MCKAIKHDIACSFFFFLRRLLVELYYVFSNRKRWILSCYKSWLKMWGRYRAITFMPYSKMLVNFWRPWIPFFITYRQSFTLTSTTWTSSKLFSHSIHSTIFSLDSERFCFSCRLNSRRDRDGTWPDVTGGFRND